MNDITEREGFRLGDKVQMIRDDCDHGDLIRGVKVVIEKFTNEDYFIVSLNGVIDSGDDGDYAVYPKDIALAERDGKVVEVKEPANIRVDSLDYEVEFTGDGFKVGCQDVSFEDARRVAEFILKQKMEIELKQGHVYNLEGVVVVVTRISNQGYIFIHLDNGNRWDDSVKTLEELGEYVKDDIITFLANSAQEYFRLKLIGNDVSSDDISF